MPYATAVPFILDSPRTGQYYPDFVRRCKAAGVSRVFLCVSMCVAEEEAKQRQLEMMAYYGQKLKAEGFEVGAWFSSLGHGGTTGGDISGEGNGLTLMRNLDGGVRGESYCPLDDNFRALACDWVQRLAKAGAQLIMLDDDFRMAWRGGGSYCCCDKHIALMEQQLGEPFDAERMKLALTTGAPNPWRDAWLYAQGEGLNSFAATLRAALDEVAPTVRLGHCAVLSTWDIDGVDSLTLARTFAGNTKPFLRLIGAPYWASTRNFDEANLATVCEYERMQLNWAKNSGVEVFGEGDVYSRPRYTTPAAYLEGMDEVLRADGTSDGILKYIFDYTASPSYETGYYDRHIRNQAIYRAIAKHFDGKQAVGVRVYEPMKTLSIAHDPGKLEARGIPASLRFVTDNSLPVRHDAGDDATVVFGDAAELVQPDDMAHGAVLDIAAAAILMRRGFDVGVAGIGEQIFPVNERFEAYNETVSLVGGEYYRVTPAESAEVLSMLVGPREEPIAPAALRYQNADGQRFVIYPFVAAHSYQTGVEHGVFRGWCRAAQLRAVLPWLSGRALDAVADPSPDLYILTKRDGDSLTVGLWNFSVDAVFCPRVRLGGKWQKLVPGVGSAMMAGDVVALNELPPFGFACFTVQGAL